MPVADIFKDRRFLYVMMAIIAVYVVLATRAFEQPGIYLDAINPDYLAVRMANPDTPTSAWLLPGNLLWKRWPLLAGLYHGSIHAYLTLPFYLVFGGTVLSLRLAHLCLGIAVAVAASLFLWKVTRSRVATAAAMLALVTDPGFIFTFRTQAHITTFPILLTLAAMGLLYAPGERRRRSLFIAGLCVGLSIWGYFIYAFMIPGLLLFTLAEHRASRVRILPSLTPLLIGLSLGILPYVVGYASLFYRVGGLHQGLAWLAQMVSSLHVNSDEGYLSRLLFVLRQVLWAATGEWHWRTFFGTLPPDGYGQTAKFAGLLLLPLVALPLAFAAGPRRAAFWITGAPIVSFVGVASLFGGRMGGHHFCLLLPLFYALAAVSLLMLTDRFFAWRGRWIAFGGLCIAAMAVNLTFFAAFITRLESQGGAQRYSAILSDYPTRIRLSGDRTAHVFMDWGGLLQFIYLTEGKVPAYDDSQLHAVLCRYDSAKVVFLGAGALKRGLQAMQTAGLTVTAIEQDSASAQQDYPFVVLTVLPSAKYCQ